VHKKACKNAAEEIHRIHRSIEAVVGKGRIKKYPMKLDHAGIKARVIKLKPYLFDIINGLGLCVLLQERENASSKRWLMKTTSNMESSVKVRTRISLTIQPSNSN
jgi:hypothetical protein